MSNEIATHPNRSLFATDASFAEIADGIDFEYHTCSNRFAMRRAEPSGLIYIDPIPAPSAISQLYPAQYEPYQFHSLPWLIGLARDLVQRSKVRVIRKVVTEQAKIIDIGCGNGTLLRLLKRYGSPKWELHANELRRDVVGRLAKEGFIVHDQPVESLPFYGKFDLVILNQVIEHFADIPRLLDACGRILRPGGAILIETPSTDGLDAHLFRRRYWGGYHFPRHFFLFNEENLEQLLRRHGFVPKEPVYLLSPAFWIQSLHHFFFDRGYPGLAKLFSIKSLPLLMLASGLDWVWRASGHATSNMRIVAICQRGRS